MAAQTYIDMSRASMVAFTEAAYPTLSAAAGSRIAALGMAVDVEAMVLKASTKIVDAGAEMPRPTRQDVSRNEAEAGAVPQAKSEDCGADKGDRVAADTLFSGSLCRASSGGQNSEGARSSARLGNLELTMAPADEARAMYYEQWDLPDRPNLLYFRTSWEERFARAVFSEEAGNEGTPRRKASPPRCHRPPSGYCLRLHSCVEETRAAYHAYKDGSADLYSSQTTLGVSASEEEFPMPTSPRPISVGDEPKQSLADASAVGTASASSLVFASEFASCLELSPRKPPGPGPRRVRPGLEYLRPAEAERGWAPLRGSESSASLVPRRPSEAPSDGKDLHKACRPLKHKHFSKSRRVLNFPVHKAEERAVLADVISCGTERRLMSASSSCSSKTMAPLKTGSRKRPPGSSAQWVETNSRPGMCPSLMYSGKRAAQGPASLPLTDEEKPPRPQEFQDQVHGAPAHASVDCAALPVHVSVPLAPLHGAPAPVDAEASSNGVHPVDAAVAISASSALPNSISPSSAFPESVEHARPLMVLPPVKGSPRFTPRRSVLASSEHRQTLHARTFRAKSAAS